MSKSANPNPDLDRLKAAFKNGRPIIFCELPPEVAYGLASEVGKLARFTHTWGRYDTAKSKLPTLVIMQISPDPTKPHSRNAGSTSGLFLARIERSGKVTSFQMRLKFVGAHPLGIASLEDLTKKLRILRHELTAESLRTTRDFASLDAIQDELLDYLWNDHREALRQLARPLPGAVILSEPEKQLDDAMAVAKSIFGLRGTPAKSTEFHLQEHHAINTDAAEVPGFDLLSTSLRGTYTFRRENEELVIYNAHQGPIEEMLGVDLVYVNETRKSVVMVQYKVLEQNREGSRRHDWVFRPDDQFHLEMGRMRLLMTGQAPDDYRMHRDPFYFKFVRRKQRPGAPDTSLVLSLAHVQHLLASQAHRGPRNGVRFSYEALEGQYLRATDFIGLVRSGYIGTHRIEFEWLKELLQRVSAGKRGLVLGVQHRV